jgi:branched-chain amino acid transport system permease protein
MTATRAAFAAMLVALVTVPLWVPGEYYISVCSQILIYGIFALAIDLLIGYAGLVSLGHAGLFSIASYTVAVCLGAGLGHATAIILALVVTLVGTAVFAGLSLRTTGVGFIMITLALGQILWGLAYRWVSVTGGDNGITVASRPAPFGFKLDAPSHFYYATLVVFALTVIATWIFVNSPFGASLKGTRDQPRRMNALGYHVWLIRFYACMFSGLLSAVAGVLFVYYTEFISPPTVQLASSAEGVLMAISGGSGTLLGPIIGAALVEIIKNVASAYISRWNMMLGAIFVAIVIFMPEGLVPGTTRLIRRAFKSRGEAAASTAAVEPSKAPAPRWSPIPTPRTFPLPNEVFALGGVEAYYGDSHVLHAVSFALGEARLLGLLGRNGAGKTTCMNVAMGVLRPRRGTVTLFSQSIAGRAPEDIARRGIALVPQGRRIFRSLTVHENLLVAARRLQANSKHASWTFDTVYDAFPRLKERQHQVAGYLSGGEQQMLAIGRALMANPRVLLMDEPSEGLAPQIVAEVMATIRRLKEQGLSIILVEQNAKLVFDIADDIVILNSGHVAVSGPTADLRRSGVDLHQHLGIY